MRAFEENSQQGGGGALEVAGLCNSQFQPIETSAHASLLFQTSCRDGPAKTACTPDIRKSSRLKNQPAALHGQGGAA